MKRLLILCTMAIFTCAPLLTMAAPNWTRNIHAEWEYDPPVDVEVSGFRLYQAGVAACEFPGATTRSGDCEVALTTKTTNYTLTALTTDGGESPPSDVFPFVDWGPRPKINSIINK